MPIRIMGSDMHVWIVELDRGDGWYVFDLCNSDLDAEDIAEIESEYRSMHTDKSVRIRKYVPEQTK